MSMVMRSLAMMGSMMSGLCLSPLLQKTVPPMVKTYSDPLIRVPQSGNSRGRRGTGFNRTRQKCKKHGHVWRFESSLLSRHYEASMTEGRFKCARCSAQATLPIKHKPHHDKINFRRSDPRHPLFNKFHAPVAALKEAA